MNLPIGILPSSTALLLIDLQVGVTREMDTRLHEPAGIVKNASSLVEAFHAFGAPVIAVNVDYGHDNALQVRVPNEWAIDFEPAPGWDTLDPRLGLGPDDTYVTKHAASAFYGTDLDVQLRRRSITTLVVAGIATHVGVESTVRSAFDRGYQQLFVEDAMGAMTAAQHNHTLENVFPMMGFAVSSAEVVAAVHPA